MHIFESKGLRVESGEDKRASIRCCIVLLVAKSRSFWSSQGSKAALTLNLSTTAATTTQSINIMPIIDAISTTHKLKLSPLDKPQSTNGSPPAVIKIMRSIIVLVWVIGLGSLAFAYSDNGALIGLSAVFILLSNLNLMHPKNIIVNQTLLTLTNKTQQINMITLLDSTKVGKSFPSYFIVTIEYQSR